MFSTPDFWVFIAFVLFLGFFGKRGLAFLSQLLDEHRQKISQQLEEAQRLHDEALSLLNSYKKKHEDALEQATNIMESAKKDALAFQKSSELEFQKLLENKEKDLVERIALETEETKSTLRDQAADEAFAIVEHILLNDPKQREKLTKAALKEMAGLALKDKG